MSTKIRSPERIVVCLAVYNGEKYLAELLDSIIGQSVSADILIRDDGSKDLSLAILHKFVKQYPNISVIESDSDSASASGNFSILLEEAIRKRQYRYYLFADQDDVWLPKKIEKLLAKLKMLEAEDSTMPFLVHSDLQVVDEQLSCIHRSFFRYQGINPHRTKLNRILIENSVTGCAMMINHALAFRSTPISKDAIMHDWWIALIAAATGRIGVIEEPLVLYRQHSDNSLGARKAGMKNVVLTLMDNQKMSLSRYYTQARALVSSKNVRLSTQQVIFLNKFIGTERASARYRLFFFCKYGIFKNSVIKNMGLYYLFLCRGYT